jgi:hypothetical protein
MKLKIKATVFSAGNCQNGTNKRAILQGQLHDAPAKYQVMLDNELYKAIT